MLDGYSYCFSPFFSYLLCFFLLEEGLKETIITGVLFFLLSLLFVDIIIETISNKRINHYQWCSKCIIELREENNTLYFFYGQELRKVHNYTKEYFQPNDTVYYCYVKQKSGIILQDDFNVIKKHNPIKPKDLLTIQPDTVRLQIDSLGILTHQ